MTTTLTQTVLVPPGGNEHFSESSVPLTLLDDSATDSQSCDRLPPRSSRLQKVVVTIQLSGVTFTSSLINGLVIVGLPAITEDLQLPSSLAFWPASVSGLATASTLLIAGSVADVLGPRWVDLVGCFTSGALMIGSGAARKGTELVAMRALQGVGLALHLASSVAIIAEIMPKGRGRNLAFSCLGLSQPLGFSVGLVLGGIFVDTIGWRAGWFLSGGLTLLLAVIGVWALPRSRQDRKLADILHDIKTKIDWVGAILASSFMTLLCYLLAILSADVSRINEPFSIVLLSLSPVALLAFIGWMHYRVKKERPALIPNSLWKNATFTSICATIALSFAVLNSMELFCSLFCDALFTVGLIVITDVFPEDTQALAGAVFNTAAQFGSALGLAILQVISTLVTKEQKGMEEIPALMEGYRASFWTMFGFMILCTVIGVLGLRRTGKIGLKRD
ncbi:hypothetical protein G7Z17_g10766 [Cylindrodendrum hubeiense]|uniref:Major facilitator superfamily (MFS) profile domain-containing protein n=1 Tax=Cylindrodendrum hubeiense TaxID=595255 RepID=A0A9P5LAX5_9HYPO|nr:hypothetical protein G7Z17_g10766 [Cylindrodendrum hubeiense]